MGFERLLGVLAPLAVVPPAVAFVATVLGWVDLARLLCLGAILSPILGLAWALTGGNGEIARGIVQPAVRGDYVVTPANLTSEEPLSLRFSPAE